MFKKIATIVLPIIAICAAIFVFGIKVYNESFDEFQYFTGLTTIAEDKFQNCTELRSTILPANISDVGKRAFFGCSSLTSITLPSNIKTIGDSAFEKCSSLSSVT
jgi:hypothetical protein